MRIGNVYVSYIDDIGENEGGIFYQVYSDKNMECEIDNGCIWYNEIIKGNREEIEELLSEKLSFYI